MRVTQSFFPFVILISIACSAAPTRRFQGCERPSLDSRHVEERAHRIPGLTSREEYNELNAREGPGTHHPNELSNLLTTSFKPVPEHWNYNTGEHTFTGKEVNQAAAEMVKAIKVAKPARSGTDNRPSSEQYPKPSTGFPNPQKDNPAPFHKDSVSYHYPLRKPDMPKNRLGPARVVGYRKTDQSALTIGVSFHDPNKPIPQAVNGNEQARNHPFSMVTPTTPSNRYRHKLKTHKLAVPELNKKTRGANIASQRKLKTRQ